MTSGELRSALTQLYAKPRKSVDSKDLIYSGIGGGLGGAIGGLAGSYLQDLVPDSNPFIKVLVNRLAQVAGGISGSIGGSALNKHLYQHPAKTNPTNISEAVAGSPISPMFPLRENNK